MADIAVLGLAIDYSRMDAGARQADNLLDRLERRFANLEKANQLAQQSLDAGVSRSVANLARELKSSEADLGTFITKYRALDDDFARRTLIFKTFGATTREVREDVAKLANAFDTLGTKTRQVAVPTGRQFNTQITPLGATARPTGTQFNTQITPLPGSGKAPDDPLPAVGRFERLLGIYRQLRGESSNLRAGFDLVAGGLSGLTQGAREAIGQAGGLSAAFGPIVGTVTNVMLGAAAAATALTVALISTADEGGKFGREILKAADSVNLTTRQTLLYKVAAEQAGISLNDYTNGIKTAQEKAQQAADGNEKLRKVFRALGVDAKAAAADPSSAFDALATKIAAVRDPLLRTQAAAELLGDTNGELIAGFAELQRNGDALQRRMDELGITFSASTAQGAKRVSDELIVLGLVTDNLKVQVANSAAPGLVSAIQSVEGAISKLGPLLTGLALLASQKIKDIADEFGGLADFINRFSSSKPASSGLTAPKTLADTIAGFAADGAGSQTRLRGLNQRDPYSQLRSALNGSGSNAAAEEKAIREAQLAIERGLADQKVSIFKGIESQQTEILQSALNDRRISIEAFYRETAKLAEQTLRAEIDAQELQRRQAQANIARLERGGATRKEQAEIGQEKTKLVGITTRIIELEDRAAAATTRNARQQQQALKDLGDAARSVEEQLADLTGGIVVPGQTKLLEQIQQFTVNGLTDAAERARQILTILDSRTRAGRQGERIDLRQSRLNLDVARVQNDVALGVIGEGEARERVLSLQREAKAELGKALQAQLALADAGSDPRAVAQIRQQIEALRELGQDELSLLRQRAEVGFLNDPTFTDTARLDAERNRLRGMQSLATDIIQLEDQIARAGEDSAMRIKRAQLGALAEILDADTRAAEERVRNQERLKEVVGLRVNPERLNDGVLKVLAEQKTLQEALEDLRANTVRDAFSGVDQVLDRLAAKMGIAGSAVLQFGKDIARLLLTKGLDKLLGLSSASGGIRGAVADALGIKRGSSSVADSVAKSADPTGTQIATATDQINLKMDQVLGLLRDLVAASRDQAACCRAGEERAATAKGPSLLGQVLGAAVTGFIGGLASGMAGGGGGDDGESGGPAFIRANPTILKPRKRALGGDVVPGAAYLVGDGGEPEIFTPPFFGQITPLSRMRSVAPQQAGPSVVNVTVPVTVQSRNELADRRTRDQILTQVAAALNRAATRNG